MSIRAKIADVPAQTADTAYRSHSQVAGDPSQGDGRLPADLPTDDPLAPVVPAQRVHPGVSSIGASRQGLMM